MLDFNITEFLSACTIQYSTIANGEVKEFKEGREVKAICFIAKYTAKRLLAITSLTTITSVHAKLQYFNCLYSNRMKYEKTF